MPEDSIQAEILRENIAHAQERPSYGNWAGGVVKQYRRPGVAYQGLKSDFTIRERERNCTTAIQPAWLMRTDLCSCLGHLQNGCEAMANSLLVLMPHSAS